MAIVKKYTADELENTYFFDFKSAYFKIVPEELKVDFNKNIIKCPVRGYASKEAREAAGSTGIYKRLFNIPIPEDANLVSLESILSYAYKELSKHPFFSNGKKD